MLVILDVQRFSRNDNEHIKKILINDIKEHKDESSNSFDNENDNAAGEKALRLATLRTIRQHFI